MDKQVLVRVTEMTRKARTGNDKLPLNDLNLTKKIYPCNGIP